MEKVKSKHEVLSKALKTLNKSLIKKFSQKYTNIDDYQELRDSIIKRFEYCADIFWKFLNEYLKSKASILEAPRPKNVYKECLDTKIITEKEYFLCIKLVEDRNLIAHSYNEEAAEDIMKKIPDYYSLMDSISSRLA
jgi:nucleotidyltransferase substrate binding protein (TIGR01987 family)